ncbi:MAG: hypothetical protein MUF86_09475 [Akkermansiaceae bacterium]|nr:hypothetical protein [Akkermansiaceae bacterium]
MTDPSTCHESHDHNHNASCGHTQVKHGDHVDFVHDGHLHHQNEDGSVEEHTLEVSAKNPDGCASVNHLTHNDHHVHGPDCGHEAVPHGDHVDYIVEGRLHHPHGDHCDDHGPVEVVK